MRIAVFYHLRFGGAKRVVYEQVKGLSEKGHIIDVYTINKNLDVFSPEAHAKSEYSYNFSEELSKLPYIGRLVNDWNIFVNLRKLEEEIARDIDNRKYDIVLVHPDRLTQAPFLLRFLKTSSVYYCQEPLRIVYEYSLRFRERTSFVNKMYEELTRIIRKYVDRENVRSATYTLASCYHIRERMIEAYDVYPGISYAGIDSKIFRPIKSSKKNQVLFIGDKNVVTDGYDIAEKALELIPISIRPRILIISWKKDNNKRMTDEELVKVYNRSRVVLCLSRLETFGLVPLEGMSCGVPVIATRVSGHRETVVNNKSGFLVEFSSQEVAEKIVYIIKNQQIAKNIGKKARIHIEKNWDWKKRINELDITLKDFIKKNNYK